MKYKGMIFDPDGVICSTDGYHDLARKALADRLGIPKPGHIAKKKPGFR